MRIARFTALLGATLLSGAAFATTPIPTLSGGTGESSRLQIEQAQQQFSNKLIFTGEKGMYLSGVNVVVRDSKGVEVLNSVTDGPMFLIDLPAGQYSVEATSEGHVEKQIITAKTNGLNTTQIRFPILDEQSEGISPSASIDNTPQYSIGSQY